MVCYFLVPSYKNTGGALMCSCGDDFCDMRSDVRQWATTQYSRLFHDPDWIAQYPNELVRESVLVKHVRSEAVEAFGQDVVDFKWDYNES